MLAAALQAEVAAVMPLLYPHGLYSSDFGPALGQFLGSSSGLSTATITRMTRHWQEEAKAFNKCSLTVTDFVCMWGVDGIHPRSDSRRTKVCLLVIVACVLTAPGNWSPSTTDNANFRSPGSTCSARASVAGCGPRYSHRRRRFWVALR
ncbi:hypothetical protein R4282_32450 [Rhodococcus oxybenzonivorans]|uniref:hypothetical protein n=1 Tax=Rhodococcus TaxID=1827 RepID=UPI001358C013|nr:MULTISPECIES: hypothetical protein [Rhodococcus]MDV7357706.1 hypothetical protein [Rhodococcus oxybenzonivorans]